MPQVLRQDQSFLILTRGHFLIDLKSVCILASTVLTFLFFFKYFEDRLTHRAVAFGDAPHANTAPVAWQPDRQRSDPPL